MGSLLPDSSSSSGFSRPFKLMFLDLSTEKTAAAGEPASGGISGLAASNTASPIQPTAGDGHEPARR